MPWLRKPGRIVLCRMRNLHALLCSNGFSFRFDIVYHPRNFMRLERLKRKTATFPGSGKYNKNIMKKSITRKVIKFFPK